MLFNLIVSILTGNLTVHSCWLGPVLFCYKKTNSRERLVGVKEDDDRSLSDKRKQSTGILIYYPFSFV